MTRTTSPGPSLQGVIERAESGDEHALADLADRLDGTLEFGTAGLRGQIGAGSNRMNRAVVIRAAAGLTAYLAERQPQPTVVIGYDARHRSDDFARDTAAVVVAAGGRALLLPRALPTPVLAFAVRHLGADAGVMVTASHNPPQDNGYKVYLGDGSQIVPPADHDIAAQIDAVPPAAQVARADDGWQVLGDDVLDAYLDAAAAVVSPDAPREPVGRAHPAARRRARRPRGGVAPQRFQRAVRRAEPGRARPRLPDRRVPEPRGARRDGRRARRRPRARRRRGPGQRPGR
ncbi:hypothetical protein GCM10025868_35620 [Angustibacter aerolatus]|uniref:Alpha-D-phosphohexomutase alpha/beta/alpha domain-containing protein n=1 Tax=Angustibacter aerolatus TaxID=1162965 RepID=A0ABQ6JKK2_9ACTN|nr:hypothetical protein GCM10025868_35620 [Angustibacter aerolatus]